ncbi:hypothetical protein FHW67_002697 [Herbaspirillum sp. Sphag1AN]|uniref:DUF1353 domain-containing protein n=1 Tax=unclassified Herbaspirillum TaxID=2624150 RepID=UPI001617185C|nr:MULTISPECIES: DUF1353 domain-containing protein [unclassified Herbaspirillum]MBB3213405.1 hypothetical protein [Herbaspirillum sp. Sphag1AN]MBB3246551.1 hypothetical protein [Herbaspirillum sp. Sphag64]
MSQFLTELVTECIDDLAASGRGIWRIVEPLVYQSDVLGKTIVVEPGFLTDYASVPRLPLAYLLFGDTSHIAAVIHDWLFHHHEVCDEPTANLVLLEASRAEGIPAWRRLGIYLGVKIGGRSSWEEDGLGNGHSIIAGRVV